MHSSIPPLVDIRIKNNDYLNHYDVDLTWQELRQQHRQKLLVHSPSMRRNDVARKTSYQIQLYIITQIGQHVFYHQSVHQYSASIHLKITKTVIEQFDFYGIRHPTVSVSATFDEVVKVGKPKLLIQPYKFCLKQDFSCNPPSMLRSLTEKVTIPQTRFCEINIVDIVFEENKIEDVKILETELISPSVARCTIEKSRYFTVQTELPPPQFEAISEIRSITPIIQSIKHGVQQLDSFNDVKHGVPTTDEFEDSLEGRNRLIGIPQDGELPRIVETGFRRTRLPVPEGPIGLEFRAGRHYAKTPSFANASSLVKFIFLPDEMLSGKMLRALPGYYGKSTRLRNWKYRRRKSSYLTSAHLGKT